MNNSLSGTNQQSYSFLRSYVLSERGPRVVLSHRVKITNYNPPVLIKPFDEEALEMLYNEAKTACKGPSKEITIDAVLSDMDDSRIYSEGVPELQAFFKDGKFVYGTKHSYPGVMFFFAGNTNVASRFSSQFLCGIPYGVSIIKEFRSIKDFKQALCSSLYIDRWLEFLCLFYKTGFPREYRNSVKQLIWSRRSKH